LDSKFGYRNKYEGQLKVTGRHMPHDTSAINHQNGTRERYSNSAH